MAPQWIERSSEEKVLVTREFNKSFEVEIKKFGENRQHPVYPILMLRKHEDWLISQYKRHVKNGYNQPIDRFFDLDGSSGYLNPDALDFYDKILLLKDTFRRDPIVLLYEDLDTAPREFISKLVSHIGVQVDWSKVNLKRIHTSYSEHQIKFLYWSYHHLAKGALRKTKVYRYAMLYLAKMIPSSWLQDITLFPEEYMQRVKSKYQEDWGKCMDYVKSHSV
jgi:hypothetical protein